MWNRKWFLYIFSFVILFRLRLVQGLAPRSAIRHLGTPALIISVNSMFQYPLSEKCFWTGLWCGCDGKSWSSCCWSRTFKNLSRKINKGDNMDFLSWMFESNLKNNWRWNLKKCRCSLHSLIQNISPSWKKISSLGSLLKNSILFLTTSIVLNPFYSFICFNKYEEEKLHLTCPKLWLTFFLVKSEIMIIIAVSSVPLNLKFDLYGQSVCKNFWTLVESL